MARVKVWLDGEILTASDLNAEFDNALASSTTPDTLDDVSGNLVEMQAVADPYPAGAASLATTMRGEIQRLRYLLKQITGKSEWYIDPDTTLAAIAADYVHAALFDANTILASNADDTPAALTISEVLDFVPSVTTGDILIRGTSEWERFSFTGAIVAFPFGTEPAGWFECDGSAISIKTYETLYDIIGNDYGLNTGITFTADSGTNVFSATGHGLSNGDIIEVTNSGGALPAGISINLKYYIINKTDDTFQLSTTAGGTAVNITSNGSGTNKIHSKFKIPDYRGRFLRAWDHGAGIDPNAATRTNRGDGTTGDYVGTKQAESLKSHNHAIVSVGPPGSGGATGVVVSVAGSVLGNITTYITAATGSETRPTNVSVSVCIKY